ncbi:hypothetical protein [Anaerotignum sp.]
MKRFFAMVLAMAMMGTTAYAAEEREMATAKYVSQKIVVDDYYAKMEGYNINGYNYMRLRDVAEVMAEKNRDDCFKFDIIYNADKDVIYLETGREYSGTEDEKETVVNIADKEAILSDAQVFVNGEMPAEGMEGYIIDGYTYYKLRDIGNAIGFHVSWLESQQKVRILTAPMAARKPVIYLYPEETTDISVELEYDGELTVTYPAYNDGWKVAAEPDGTLTNHADGREYSYLFWEGEGYGEMDFSEGFVVKGEDTVAFLQEKLSAMGMTPREYNEFIVYWLPYMQDNAYNLISFQWENYDESAKLHITPAPDNLLRVFMAFKALEEPVDIPEQELPTLQRAGFTVVEWGGTEVY